MSYLSRVGTLPLIALLFGGSALFEVVLAHSEGIEAADPSTPAALLSLDSAHVGYTITNAVPLNWLELFEDRTDSVTPMHDHAPMMDANMHSGHSESTNNSSTTSDK